LFIDLDGFGVKSDNIFIRIIRDVFSFELLFILYLFAWVYKADPRLGWIPVDLTQLFFILSVCSGIIVFLAGKKRFRRKAVFVVFSGVLFVIYVLISLTWTKGNIYAGQKALYISTLTLWALIACAFIIASDKNRMARFINFLLLTSVWIAIESTLKYIRGSIDVINALNSNYLALGYSLGTGLLISLAYGFLSGKSLSKRFFMLAMSLYFMFLLFVLGGRGPLLSVIISLLIPLVFRNNFLQSNKIRIKKYAAFVVILLLVLIITSICLYLRNTLTATLYRMLLFLEPGMGTSAGTRMGYYLTAVKLWLLNPVFGYGIGSWPILIGLPDMNSYPHNLILEILVELGLTGLILFGSTVFIAIRGFIRSNNCKIIFLGSVILMMFANAFISSMLSGDINDNRIIFAVLGLMAFEGSENEKEDMRSDNSA
jgi:O-antigen ligase